MDEPVQPREEGAVRRRLPGEQRVCFVTEPLPQIGALDAEPDRPVE